MTTTTDPRNSLPTNAAGVDRSMPVARAEYLDFAGLTSDSCPAGATWTVRGQNALIHYLRPNSRGEFVTATFDSETALILTGEAAAVTVTWNGSITETTGHGLVVIPPGKVNVTNAGTADLALLVRTDEQGWNVAAANAPSYDEPHPRVAPATPWPEPAGGERVRTYHVKDIEPEPGRFGRIFRTRSFMVNFLPTQNGPRDKTKLSPHYHDDFEQYSLATAGSYLHHIRTPWVTDSSQWVDDEHVEVGSPSVAIIPPPTVHTSEARGSDTNVLIDIFSPPRLDFSAKAGWVLNADDYPQP